MKYSPDNIQKVIKALRNESAGNEPVSMTDLDLAANMLLDVLNEREQLAKTKEALCQSMRRKMTDLDLAGDMLEKLRDKQIADNAQLSNDEKLWRLLELLDKFHFLSDEKRKAYASRQQALFAGDVAKASQATEQEILANHELTHWEEVNDDEMESLLSLGLMCRVEVYYRDMRYSNTNSTPYILQSTQLVDPSNFHIFKKRHNTAKLTVTSAKIGNGEWQ